MSFLILGTSIALQLAAAVLALRLIRVTGVLVSWVLIASALILMALRRSITFYNLVFGDAVHVFNSAAEITALMISMLMVIGIYRIRPYFLAHAEALESVRQSRASYREILENMTDTFYRMDNRGVLTIVSASSADLLGYSPDELVGKQLDDLHIDSGEWEAFLLKLQESEKVTAFEAMLRCKDGSRAIVESNARFVTNEYGENIGVEGLARDISQRKKTEQITTRLGRIIEDSINEIYVFDGETLNFILLNRGARENLGYTVDETLKLTPVDLKPEFNEAQFRALIQPLRDGTREAIHFETVHARKDGSTYPVDARVQLAQLETPPVFFAIIQDTSERKQKERELIRSQKLGAIGQLTGGIAHDFNNLLTVVLGNLDIAQSAPGLPATITDYLDASTDAAKKCALLTQRLLAFSRKQSLNPKLVELEQLINDVSPLVRHSVRQDISIDIDCRAGTWPCEVDVGQFENVLLNLAINANDAMSSGGKLTISTRNAHLDEQGCLNHPDATPGDYVLLSVSDTGHGMTPDVLSRAIEPFFTTKQDGEGTGLGLSMIYGFINQSGGVIDIKSEVGTGTTVNIYLPRAAGCVDQSPAAPKEKEDPLGSGERVLIVEDNESILKLTGKLLDQLGYKVFQASDADAAIEVLEHSGDIDLMLTDIILHGSIDGVQLAEEAQRRWPTMNVMYMSGYSEIGVSREKRMKPGITLLHKPFTKAQLARIVNQVIRQS